MSTATPGQIKRGVFRNSTVLFLARLATILASLVVIPFAVRALGLRGYGTWEALFAISMLSNVFQSAITGAVLWKMSGAFGVNDLREIRRIVRISTGATLTILSVCAPCVFALRHVIVRFLNIPIEFATQAENILPALCALMIVSGINETLVAAIAASQRVGIASVLQALGLLVNYAVVITTLLAGAGLGSLLCGYSAGFLITMVALYTVSRHIYGTMSLVPDFPTAEDRRVFLPYMGFLLIGSVAILFRDQMDKILLARFADPAWVGYYGIALRMASPILMICGFFYVPVISASSAMNSQGNWPDIRKLYQSVLATLSLLAGALVVLLAVLHERLITLWIGKPMPEITPILYWLLAGNLTAAVLTGAGSSMCKGLGRPGIETKYVVFSLILNIILKAVLIPTIGPLGTVVASAGSWAAGSVLFVFLLHSRFDLPRLASALAALSILAALVAAASVRALGRTLAAAWAPGLLPIAVIGAAALIVYGGLILALRPVVLWSGWRISPCDQ